MIILLLLLGASFALCALLTPLAGWMASRWGLLDRPDAHRKLHGKPIPVAGGLAVLVTVCAILGVTRLVSHPLRDLFASEALWLLGLLLAAVFLCLVGVLDDFGRLRGRHKLVGQFVAACVVIAFDVRILHIELFGWNLELGIWGLPFTILWLLGAINSLNLLDGMDGMLGCVGFVIAGAMACMAVLTGNWVAACVAAALAGVLLGFLCHNLPPASIFMGDAGSMVTGLVIGVLGIRSSIKAPATVVLLVPVALLTIPFLDTAAAILRRKLTGRSIYATDRGHLHHCLSSQGYSTPQVLAWVSLFCLVCGGGALASVALKHDVIAAITVLTVVGVLVTTRLFGYAEFSLVKSRLHRLVRSFLQVRGQGRFQRVDVQMHGTANWKLLLDVVTAHAFELNLQTVRLDVSAPALNDEYHAQWDRFEKEKEAVLWRAEVPLVIGGQIVGLLLVSGYPDVQPTWVKVAALDSFIEAFEYSGAGYPAASPHHSRPGWKEAQQLPEPTSRTPSARGDLLTRMPGPRRQNETPQKELT